MRKLMIFGIMLTLLWAGVGALTPSDAHGFPKFWKKGDAKEPKKVQRHLTVDPEDKSPAVMPDRDFINAHCEPIRLKVVGYNRKPFFIRPFYQAQVVMTKRQHERCLADFEEQEIDFMKRYDINVADPPTLMPMQVAPESLSPEAAGSTTGSEQPQSK